MKLFEVRDRCTNISVFAFKLTSDGDPREIGILQHAGWNGYATDCVIVGTLDENCRCHCMPEDWSRSSRTLPEAHRMIVQHWDTLKSGDVVDVEFLLGETTVAKVSEYV